MRDSAHRAVEMALAVEMDTQATRKYEVLRPQALEERESCGLGSILELCVVVFNGIP